MEFAAGDDDVQHPAREREQVPARGLERGLTLLAGGAWFEAHEAFEAEWREAPPSERDFLQGLVHVAVAWLQSGRGRRIGCERQLEKAARRLGPYAPRHREVNVSGLLGQVAAALHAVRGGSLALPPVVLDPARPAAPAPPAASDL